MRAYKNLCHVLRPTQTLEEEKKSGAGRLVGIERSTGYGIAAMQFLLAFFMALDDGDVVRK